MKRSTHGLNLIHSSTNGQQGFTLIELIMVIVLLGLLAVVAVPKYQDMKTDAAVAQADGVFGAAQGAAAISFANNLVNSTGTVVDTGAHLLAAMDSTPEGWTADDAATPKNINATINGVNYNIKITTAESTSAKAVLTADWH